MTRKVFAIVVTYNGINWIEKCLNSLILSTIPVNIIIIDNGSTDGTQAIIQSCFKNVDFIQSTKNLGFGKANNIGIKRAYELGADYIFLLNQDAWIQSDTFSVLVESHNLDRSFGILSPIHLNSTGSNLDHGFYKYADPQKCPSLLSDSLKNKTMRNIYEVEFVNAAAWMISKECIYKTGGFSPLFFHYGEDVDYTNRARFHGFRIGVCPGTYINHDRENRVANSIAQNSINLNSIMTRRKYSNPFEEISIDLEIEKLQAQAKRFLCSLKLKKYHSTKSNIEELSTIKKELQKIMPLVKKGGLVFLQ